MVFNTLTVATAVTPSVIETYFSHVLHRAPLRQKPTAHISYHEGLRLIRQFLDYSSKHTVEDLQQFTAQWVPVPHWVRTLDIEIAPQFLERAAKTLQDQLGRRGLEKVGGMTWWQWRSPDAPLRAEWIEMKKDYHERKRLGTKCDRVIFYVHGGAYYFGSVDEHRYQMQRHARKLKARVLAPRYRLAPQYPFPCGLYDCIASYLYLLEHFEPNQILFAGDSAGGGMVLSLLVTLRDQGRPLPAGTILLSPWVDLTHSFPSVTGDGVGDYIPPHGFHHKPSMAWPPPPNEEIERTPKTFDSAPSGVVELPATAGLDMDIRKKPPAGSDGDADEDDSRPSIVASGRLRTAFASLPGLGENLSITLDGKPVVIKDQIQLYAPNELLSHPLVSPVQQPSLGGLPPMLIQVGGAELLRDEQIYLAHKAASPTDFPPSDAVLKEYDVRREMVDKYPPTDVQLQVWEDLCHVPHTLSFTRPAKYMYRSVAQFGAWALAHAQHTGVDIQDDDAVSIISSGPDTADEADATAVSGSTRDLRKSRAKTKKEAPVSNGTENGKIPLGAVGKAGDALPPFRDHMIRQRVTRHGVIYPLALPSEMACLHLDPATIGTIKPGPVGKWLAKKSENEARFATEVKKVQKKKAKELLAGYDDLDGEVPAPTALIRRRKKGTGAAPEEKKKGKGWGLAMWSGWGSAHDESTLNREEKNEKDASGQPSMTESRAEGIAIIDAAAINGAASTSNLTVPGETAGTAKKKRRTSSASMLSASWNQKEQSRPRSPYRQVTDTGQANESGVDTEARSMYSRQSSASTGVLTSRPVSMATTSAPPPTTSDVSPDSERVPGSEHTFLSPSGAGRPHNGTSAFPFRLKYPMNNPSTATLESEKGVAIAPVELPPMSEKKKDVQADNKTKDIEATKAVKTVPATREALEDAESVREQLSPARTKEESWLDLETKENVASPVGEPAGVTAAAVALEGIRKRSVDSPVSQGERPSPFRSNTPVFDPRTSVLGSIGPDGMPTAPLTARHNEERTQTFVANEAKEDKEARPESPADGNGSVPFKIRNPVFDSRAAALLGENVASALHIEAENQPQASSQTSAEPGKLLESTKMAPFKLRHTVYDPKVGPVIRSPTPEPALPVTSPTAVSPPAPRAKAEDSARVSGDRAEEITALPPLPNKQSSQPSSNGFPPNYNVIMPTTIARRPIPFRQGTAPRSPAKDEAARLKTTPKAASDEKKGSSVPVKTEGKKHSEEKAAMDGGALPRGKFGGPAPMLDDFKFDVIDLTPDEEKKRWPFDSFAGAGQV